MAEPKLVRDIRSGILGSYPSNLEALGRHLFFTANNGLDGIELWKTDGKTTTIVSDIYPGFGGSEPDNLSALNDSLYFVANDGKGNSSVNRQIWRTNGVFTNPATSFPGDAAAYKLWNLVKVGQSIYFSPKRGEELWLIDSAGPYQILDYRTTIKSPSPRNLVDFNGTLFFTADDFYTGRELWRYEDKYPYSPFLVSDIETGKGNSNPSSLTPLRDFLYFSAFASNSGRELWRTDGRNSTRIVADIRKGNLGSNPENLINVGNLLYFTAYTEQHGRELWKSDGTTTTLVSSLRPGAIGSYPENLTAVGHTLFFTADNGVQGRELWGVTKGILSHNFDLHPGSLSSNPNNLTAVGNTLYFSAENRTIGSELWKTDGRTAKVVGNINPGAFGSYPSDLIVAGGSLYFSARDNIRGRELWMLDVFDDLKKPTSTSITGIIDNVGLLQGQITHGGFTDDRTPIIIGKLSSAISSGESIRVFNGSKLVGIAKINNKSLTWSLTPTLPLPAAIGTKYILTARVARINGTLGSASASRSFTLDLTPPTTRVAISNVIDDAGKVKGSIANRARTDDQTPIFSGTISDSLQDGESLRIFNGTKLLGNANVNNKKKTWSFTPTLPKPSRLGLKYVITASVADKAGNLSRASNNRTFILTSSPDSPFSYEGNDASGKPFLMTDYTSDAAGNRNYFTEHQPSWKVSFRVKNDQLDPLLPTYVYTHGWKDRADSSDSNIIFAALSGGKHNVVNVDWSSMASVESSLQPDKAVTVTRQVGETVADFLIRNQINPNKTTLIGHSLGSFVSASAANQIRNQTSKKVKELVALDTAFGVNYDIDARNNTPDTPLNFTTQLADTTSSYTVSDLLGGIDTSAGDNSRATTAINAYLVQYVRSNNLPLLSPNPIDNSAQRATGLHNGVISVYADLFRKNALHPRTRTQFDAAGKPSATGLFDGVITAALPWSLSLNSVTRRGPKAIGWANKYRDPIIYGSDANDVMFFDEFADAHNGSWLVGYAGNDWLVPSQLDGIGIDRVTGGPGNDQFWFGYQRYGERRFPYGDIAKLNFGGSSYAVVMDFKPNEDYINFAWSSTQITYKSGAAIHPSLVAAEGVGVGFLSNNDLIAYVRGLLPSQVPELIRTGRLSFGQFAQLDSALFA